MLSIGKRIGGYLDEISNVVHYTKKLSERGLS